MTTIEIKRRHWFGWYVVIRIGRERGYDLGPFVTRGAANRAVMAYVLATADPQ